MVAFTSLLTAAVSVLATTASAAPAAPVDDHAIEARGVSLALFRALATARQEFSGQYIFGADKINNIPQSWWDGLAGFGGGKCEYKQYGRKILRSGQSVPTVSIWHCKGGGWFPNFQQAEKEGLNVVCPWQVACGKNDGGLWGN